MEDRFGEKCLQPFPGRKKKHDLFHLNMTSSHLRFVEQAWLQTPEGQGALAHLHEQQQQQQQQPQRKIFGEI